VPVFVEIHHKDSSLRLCPALDSICNIQLSGSTDCMSTFCFLCVVGDSRFWALLYVHHHRVSISWSMARSLNVNWGLSAGITQSKASFVLLLLSPRAVLLIRDPPFPPSTAWTLWGMRDDGDVLHI
jgi:hypothetical protein